MAQSDWHVPKDLFGRFFRAETSRDESRRVVRHLMGGCPQCVEFAYRIATELGLWMQGRPVWEAAYDEIFERAFAFATAEEQRIAVERLRGWGQWAALEPMSPQVRVAAVEADSGYHTSGFYD